MRFKIIALAQKIDKPLQIGYKIGDARAKLYVSKAKKYLKRGDKILDFGSGSCNVVEILRDDGFDVTPVDIVNMSFVKGIKPVIYDGKKLPFKNNQFDVGLILVVLHHIADPEAAIREVSRVCKKVIIIEEVYENLIRNYATFIWDSVVNIEFIGHPHSNKTDEAWKETFKIIGLKLKSEDERILFGFLKENTYYLEK
jgi:ubiquinone/menaquinone biosynthesis C-methylase UbiE